MIYVRNDIYTMGRNEWESSGSWLPDWMGYVTVLCRIQYSSVWLSERPKSRHVS